VRYLKSNLNPRYTITTSSSLAMSLSHCLNYHKDLTLFTHIFPHSNFFLIILMEITTISVILKRRRQFPFSYMEYGCMLIIKSFLRHCLLLLFIQMSSLSFALWYRLSAVFCENLCPYGNTVKEKSYIWNIYYKVYKIMF